MTTQENGPEKYNWLPNGLGLSIKEMGLNDKERVKLDALLEAVRDNRDHERLGDRWVVAEKKDFPDRLKSLLANHFGEIGGDNPRDELKRSVTPDGYIAKMTEELNKIKSEVGDDGEPLEEKKRHSAIEVSDKDLEDLKISVKSWLDHVWSLRENDNGLLGEYIRSMRLIEDEDGSTDAMMTLDAYASEMIKGLSGDLFRFVSFGDSVDRDIRIKEGDEYVKKFYKECRDKLQAKVKEVAMKALQEWQDKRKEMDVAGDNTFEEPNDEISDLVRTKNKLHESLEIYRLNRIGGREERLKIIKKIIHDYVGRTDN